MRLVAERSRIEGEYLAAVGEMASRNGSQAVAHVLREEARMNSSQARSESRLAESLAEQQLTDTLDALRAGEIQASHARVIAREVPKKHRRSETEFIELCRAYPSETVARHPFAYVSQQVYADIEAEAAAKGLGPIDAELELQRAQRSGSMRLGTDGMWHLWAKFDFMTGRHLNAVIQAAVRSARRRAGDHNSGGSGAGGVGIDFDGSVSGDVEPTQAQLIADAISDLIGGPERVRRANNEPADHCRLRRRERSARPSPPRRRHTVVRADAGRSTPSTPKYCRRSSRPTGPSWRWGGLATPATPSA